METASFLVVDDQSLSLKQSLQYLQTAGKLQLFIGEVIRQYIIEQELNHRSDLDISPAFTEQAVINFRLERQLTDPNVFQEWLTRNGLDYATFHNQVVSSFKLEKLKIQIAEHKLQEYFIERKLFLDRVVLSRITVQEQELAEELYSQIVEGARFEQLAQEYSLAEDRIVNGMMGPVSRGTLPDHLRTVIDSASTGDVLAPLELDKNWCIFRVEQFLPASLDGPLQQELQNQLFEQWLVEKMQKMTIKLQVL